MTTIGILIFEQADELDFTGPYESLRIAAQVCPDLRVVLVAPQKRLLTMEMGMHVMPHHDFAEAPPLDVVIVPGGTGARLELERPETVDWLKCQARDCRYLCSVCTGALLLAGCGLADGRQLTTHHNFLEELRLRHPECHMVGGQRVVQDGHLATAGGIVSGFDLALLLVRRLCPEGGEAHLSNYLALDMPSA